MTTIVKSSSDAVRPESSTTSVGTASSSAEADAVACVYSYGSVEVVSKKRMHANQRGRTVYE